MANGGLINIKIGILVKCTESVCRLRFKNDFVSVSAAQPNGELHVRHGQGVLGRHVLQATGQSAVFYCVRTGKVAEFTIKISEISC